MCAPFTVASQQNKNDMKEVEKILDVVKAESNMAYTYSLHVVYPNGQKDHIDGEVAIDNSNGLIYNSCTAFTIIYDGHWLYRADHRKKTVSIIDLTKNVDTAFKRDLESELFKNIALNQFVDSVVYTYGGVKRLDRKNDTTWVELIFPDQMPIKDFDVVYDERNKKIAGYHLRTFKKWPGNEFGKNKGTTEVMDCRKFKRVTDFTAYGCNNFFTVNHGTVTAKKYNKYKLNTKL